MSSLSNDWERNEPPLQLEWVDQFMREVQSKYLLWDKQYGEGAYPIVFTEGQYTFDSDEPEVRKFQEVAFFDGDGLIAIGDDHVYWKRSEAMIAAKAARIRLLGDRRLLPEYREAVRVWAFRHGDSEWGTACSIEKSVRVNRLGWAVFVRRDLLEGTNIVVPEYPKDE